MSLMDPQNWVGVAGLEPTSSACRTDQGTRPMWIARAALAAVAAAGPRAARCRRAHARGRRARHLHPEDQGRGQLHVLRQLGRGHHGAGRPRGEAQISWTPTDSGWYALEVYGTTKDGVQTAPTYYFFTVN